MMFEECPICHAMDLHSDGPYSDTCTCSICGAQFDTSTDGDGDITVGDRIDE